MKTSVVRSFPVRPFLPVCASILASLVLLAATPAHAQTPGSIDPAFNVGVGPDTGQIRAIIPLADGKLLVGGTFQAFDGNPCAGVARLNADGSLDVSFDAGTGIDYSVENSGVYALALQPDGRIIVAGGFIAFNGTPEGNIVRLLANGAVDPSFHGGSAADELIRAVALQPDGKIVIGGKFETVSGVAAGTALARLNADGSLDTGFRTGILPVGEVDGHFYDNAVFCLALQPDGKVIVGGNFDTGLLYNLARFNADGTADGAFGSDFGAGGEIYALALQTDGKILAVGPTRNVKGSVEYDGIVRLNADGNLDAAFAPDLGVSDFFPNAVAIQADGKILIGGSADFTEGPQGVVRLAANGTFDAGYSAGTNTQGGRIFALAVQADNKALVGGGFTPDGGAPANDLFRVIGGPLDATPPPPPTGGTASVTLNVATLKISEAGPAGKLTVTRTGDTSSALTVAYTTKGSAAPGTNYKALTGTVTIPAGSATAKIKIKPKDDGAANGTHVIKLTLVAGNGYTVGTVPKTKIKITDAD